MDIKALNLSEERYLTITLTNGIQLSKCAILSIEEDHVLVFTTDQGSGAITDHHIANESIAMVSYATRRSRY